MKISIMEKATYLQRLIYEVSRSNSDSNDSSLVLNFAHAQKEAEKSIDAAIDLLCDALVFVGKSAYRVEDITKNAKKR